MPRPAFEKIELTGETLLAQPEATAIPSAALKATVLAEARVAPPARLPDERMSTPLALLPRAEVPFFLVPMRLPSTLLLLVAWKLTIPTPKPPLPEMTLRWKGKESSKKRTRSTPSIWAIIKRPRRYCLMMRCSWATA